MRRLIFGTSSLIMVMALVGCAASSQAAGAGSAAVSLNEDYAEALPVVTQLVVGTLKLEQTDLAITSDEATQLVPLWQAYRSLLTSQTSAPQEREALVIQIEQTMTSAQIKAIAAMKLTSADMQTVFRGRNPQAQGTPSGTQEPGRRQFSGQGGGFVGGGEGGFPGGGGLAGGGGFAGNGGGFFGGLAPGQTPNPQAIETLRAQRGGTSGLGGGVNPGLVSVLIQFLEQKSGATPMPTPTAG